MEYVGYLYQILICENMFKCKAFFVSILIRSGFYLSAAVTNRCQCKQQDVQKTMGNSLPNAPSHVRHSATNRQAAEEQS